MCFIFAAQSILAPTLSLSFILFATFIVGPNLFNSPGPRQPRVAALDVAVEHGQHMWVAFGLFEKFSYKFWILRKEFWAPNLILKIYIKKLAHGISDLGISNYQK